MKVSSTPKFYFENSMVEKWFNYFLLIINCPVDPSLEVKGEENEIVFSKSVFWKIKHICFNITYRIFQKFGIENNENTYKNFTKIVNEKLSKSMFEAYIQVLYSSSNKFVPSTIVSTIFKFFNQLVARNKQMNILIPHLNKILNDFIIQESFISKSTIELFENVLFYLK